MEILKPEVLRFSDARKDEVLANLLDGTEKLEATNDGDDAYINPLSCWDALGFCCFLAGWPLEHLERQRHPEDWVRDLGVEHWDHWRTAQGLDIPPAHGLVFMHLDDEVPASTPYFHAAVSVGGGYIRGCNGRDLGQCWDDPVPLRLSVWQNPAAFVHDRQLVAILYSPLYS